MGKRHYRLTPLMIKTEEGHSTPWLDKKLEELGCGFYKDFALFLVRLMLTFVSQIAMIKTVSQRLGPLSLCRDRGLSVPYLTGKPHKILLSKETPL